MTLLFSLVPRDHYLLTSRFEADPEELVRSVEECIEEVWQENEEVRVGGVKCVGIANQRETIVLWDKTTGQCLYNAVGGCGNSSSAC